MKPSLPQGTRDFNATTIRKRNYIFNTIKNVFELYGFQPLETPAMENLDTLTGKYGEEGDKLLFKILNNGLERKEKHEQARLDFEKVLEGKNVAGITERALRYDLTIPFARYVAMNYGQLNFPFKRYQVQPVWRADRPQKGRYREFFQCDADVVGSNSLLNEVELINIYTDVFKQLNVDVEIKINNRKILSALAELCGGSERITDITVPIDKLDKIGWDKVKTELADRGLQHLQIELIEQYISIDGDNESKINNIKSLIGEIEIGRQGIRELEFLLSHNQDNANFSIDFTLARGLNYYTGTIIEIKAQNVQMGSIGGGGRYDDLTGLFDVPGLPGVGISFGVDRMYDVMEELKLFPSSLQTSTQVLFFNLGEAESKAAYDLLRQLRNNKVKAEIYHEAAKFDKQFKYAERNNIPYIIIIGSKELEAGSCVIKNIATGKQETIEQAELISFSFE
ncbi:histidine--tRNA ligase [Parafilimonas terrae]|uniref:Histidine--tRNA ligase n=1 Tax=Parafilimonas terrae TaxID=1465490 RepID=A0A1I5U3K9_9BACT|nr:histidine--tRNA ligase [Parafilimonas terrae]SFP89477.1 histidyl-tRNA synthetase [Parafilimonas terrae]